MAKTPDKPPAKSARGRKPHYPDTARSKAALVRKVREIVTANPGITLKALAGKTGGSVDTFKAARDARRGSEWCIDTVIAEARAGAIQNVDNAMYTAALRGEQGAVGAAALLYRRWGAHDDEAEAKAAREQPHNPGVQVVVNVAAPDEGHLKHVRDIKLALERQQPGALPDVKPLQGEPIPTADGTPSRIFAVKANPDAEPSP